LTIIFIQMFQYCFLLHSAWLPSAVAEFPGSSWSYTKNKPAPKPTKSLYLGYAQTDSLC